MNVVGPTIRRRLWPGSMRATAAFNASSAGLSRLRLPCARMHAGVTLTLRDAVPKMAADRAGGVGRRQLLAAGAVTDAAVSANGVTICGWAGRQNAVSSSHFHCRM